MASIWTALMILCAGVVAMTLPGVSASGRIITKTSSWNLCSSKSYAVNIQDVVIKPDPVVAGDLATFTIPAYANEEVDGGTVVVTVSFHGIKVHTEKDDLCSKAACPIKGEFTLNNSEALPSYTPPGSYKLKFQVLDKSGKEMACASVSFSIVWQSELEQLIDTTSAVDRDIGHVIM